MKKISNNINGCEALARRRRVSHLFMPLSHVDFIKRGLMPLLLIAVITGLSSCKTTVKNYQAAYDVAIQKKEREDSARRELQKEMGMGTIMSEDADGFSPMTRNGEEFFTYRQNFLRKDSVEAYSVCVGIFKMPANAASMTADLQASGFEGARSAEASGKYFVLAGESAEMDRAIEILGKFRKKNPDWHCVGLPGATIIIGRGL